MSKSATVFAQALARMLNLWVVETNRSIDGQSELAWFHEEAFERSRRVMQAIPSADRAAFFEDFVVGFVHSLLLSLEQRAIHLTGSAVSLRDADTGEPLPRDFHEMFLDAVEKRRRSGDGVLG